MKNIHVIPTDKPSRLLYSGNNKNLLFSKEPISFRTFERSPQNIYITSDEEIKEGDWFHYRHFGEDIISKADKNTDLVNINNSDRFYQKIILTTDQDLIADGVQAIDDEFLEWFVKNPSCEKVEVEIKPMFPMYSTFIESIDNPPFYGNLKRKIIIPQEEPKQELERGITITHVGKQETLEEANWKVLGTKDDTFYNGANWQADRMGLMEIELRHTKTLLASCEKALEDRDKQAERMYSEEEVLKLVDGAFHMYASSYRQDAREWLVEQFKKK